MKKSPLVVAATLLFGLAACDSATAPTGIDQIDVNELASNVDALTVLTLGDAGATAIAPRYSLSPSDATPLASASTVSRTFTNTRACPVSGSITISGTVSGTSDPVAQNLSITATATKTDAACAFNTRHGVVTINGNPNVTITNTVNIVAGKPSGPQATMHKGSYTWTRGTNSGTCNVDVTSVFDPTAGTFTITGTMCGRTVNVTRTGAKLG